MNESGVSSLEPALPTRCTASSSASYVAALASPLCRLTRATGSAACSTSVCLASRWLPSCSRHRLALRRLQHGWLAVWSCISHLAQGMGWWQRCARSSARTLDAGGYTGAPGRSRRCLLHGWCYGGERRRQDAVAVCSGRCEAARRFGQAVGGAPLLAMQTSARTC